jgi:hypothetical protein
MTTFMPGVELRSENWRRPVVEVGRALAFELVQELEEPPDLRLAAGRRQAVEARRVAASIVTRSRFASAMYAIAAASFFA